MTRAFLAMPRQRRNRLLLLGGAGLAGVVISLVSLRLLSVSRGQGSRTAAGYFIPPWASRLPESWRDLAFWKGTSKLQAKIHAAQTIKDIQTYGLEPQPTYGEFIQAYRDIGDEVGVPGEVIRGHHAKESYFEVAPLILNSRTTALGLGQVLSGTANEIGIPYVYLLHWRNAIWATGKYLRMTGWNRSDVPSKGEIEAAAKLAGTSSEPKWFKANRAYYSLGADKLEKSTAYAAQRLSLAAAGFDAATNPSMPYWRKLPHADELKKFFAGTAKSVDWRQA